MAAICNGLYAHGGLRPYCATFLNFIGYALGAVRLSALSRFGVIYVMTHDSIGLGEDGPTHQPVEMLQYLRSTPNLLTLRPADGNETSGAYAVAIQHAHTPSVISLSRQAVPTLAGTSAAQVAKGAYILRDFQPASSTLSHPSLVLIGTGTEVSLALQTAEQLLAALGQAHWIRVVSMPCTELFDAQSVEYQLQILPEHSPVMSIEAAGTAGWQKYAHAPYGIPDCYGMSAPADKIYQHFGLTAANLVVRAQEVITFYTGADGQVRAPSLVKVPRFPAPHPLH